MLLHRLKLYQDHLDEITAIANVTLGKPGKNAGLLKIVQVAERALAL